jgi:hypothetical protein
MLSVMTSAINREKVPGGRAGDFFRVELEIAPD